VGHLHVGVDGVVLVEERLERCRVFGDGVDDRL